MNEKKCRQLVEMRAVWKMRLVYGGSTPMCEFCGWRVLDEMHHRMNRSQGGLWVPSNILGLCWQDHRWATTHPLLARQLGVSIRSTDVPDKFPVKVWYAHKRVLFDDLGGYQEVSTIMGR